MTTAEVTWTREYIRSLIFSLEDRVGATSVITSEIPTGENVLSRFGVEEFLASGVILLGLTRNENKLKRTLIIRKMRWTSTKPEMYGFTIERGKGIVLEGVAS